MTTIYNKRSESITAVATPTAGGKPRVTIQVTVKADAIVLETPAATTANLVFSKHDIEGIIIVLANSIDMACELTRLRPSIAAAEGFMTPPGITTMMVGIQRDG